MTDVKLRQGERFGRLTVIKEMRIPRQGQRTGHRAAECRCSCGNPNLVTALVYNLASGRTRSCGCLQRETAAMQGKEMLTIHGLWNHPLYKTWHSMLRRCYNERDTGYKNYGGRGITVCDEWHDVAAFIAWIEENLGPRPEGYSLDRIRNSRELRAQQCPVGGCIYAMPELPRSEAHRRRPAGNHPTLRERARSAQVQQGQGFG